jgi:hypothetical protein
MRRIAVVFAAVCLAALLVACSIADGGSAELWTDAPELALAAELFNSSQERYIVEVQWKANLADALRQAKTPPSLVVGRYLKGQAVRDRFQALDYLFGELVVNQASFYPDLLALGNIDGRQLLLPVSFNLPAVIFPRTAVQAGNDFVLGIGDIGPAAAAFNRKEKGAYSRMGFSPRWDGNFLTLAINAAGAGFREGKPLSWSEAGLAASLESMRSWVAATNGSAAAEDDFQFKYLFTPAYQYVSSGRTLFAYMNSADLFVIPEEKRADLDFRWFAAADGSVPVSDDIVYAAIPRSGKGKPAAEAFLKWFFREDSQKSLLERSRRIRALELSFGVAYGFSSIRSVNEKAYPLYYPSLVGHMPPAEALAAPKVLPSDWPALKAAVVAPWLVEITARAGLPTSPGEELAARIAAYRKRAAQR